MRFSAGWIDLIMKCVTTVTVSYRVKVNGSLMEKFHPSRGSRQGGPLSPYLFLICAEGFLALLNAAEEEGKLQGLPFVRMHRVLPTFCLMMTGCS